MDIHTSEVTGFTYAGDVLCTGDADKLATAKLKALGVELDPGDIVHDRIAAWARREFPQLGIWTPGEFWTYDTAAYCSEELPKPFTRDQVADDEECHVCGARLDHR